MDPYIVTTQARLTLGFGLGKRFEFKGEKFTFINVFAPLSMLKSLGGGFSVPICLPGLALFVQFKRSDAFRACK